MLQNVKWYWQICTFTCAVEILVFGYCPVYLSGRSVCICWFNKQHKTLGEMQLRNLGLFALHTSVPLHVCSVLMH